MNCWARPGLERGLGDKGMGFFFFCLWSEGVLSMFLFGKDETGEVIGKQESQLQVMQESWLKS